MSFLCPNRSKAVQVWGSLDPSLGVVVERLGLQVSGFGFRVTDRYSSQFENNHSTEMCSSSEAGSYLRLIDVLSHPSLELRVMKKRRRSRVSGFGTRNHCREYRVQCRNAFLNRAVVCRVDTHFKSQHTLSRPGTHPSISEQKKVRGHNPVLDDGVTLHGHVRYNEGGAKPEEASSETWAGAGLTDYPKVDRLSKS